MTTDITDPLVLRQQLVILREEHRGLNQNVADLEENPLTDQLLIRRLKKRKLQVKDTIARLESLLIPDMDA